MQKLATLALVAFVLAGCGTQAAPITATGLAPVAASVLSHKKTTPDNAVLSYQELQQAKAAVEKALNKNIPDMSVKISDEKFTRTMLPGLLQFTATQTSVGFAGRPIKSTISGTVDLNKGAVKVDERSNARM